MLYQLSYASLYLMPSRRTGQTLKVAQRHLTCKQTTARHAAFDYLLVTLRRLAAQAGVAETPML
jgi:hypothetical protein